MHRFVRLAALGLLSSAFALMACSPPPSTDRCGDGNVTGSEACDDGNTTDGDGCQADCSLPGGGAVCGNGQVETGELCDDGNTTGGDGCEADCTLTGTGGGGGGGNDGGNPAVCGNSVREGAELCDDGNQVDTDACKNNCSLPPPGPYCGDGTTNGSEACDDGNVIPGDNCENDCTATVAATSASTCGDNTRQTPELCDDGNTTPGDGCEPDCTPTTVAEVTCPAAAIPAPSSGACEASAGDNGRLIIGTVLLPGRVLKGGQVLVGADGNIACVSCDCSAAAGFATAARLICGTNVVSPGLINSHDHITYPAPPFVAPGVGANGLLADGGVPERYEHRHDWRQGNDGHSIVSNGGTGNNTNIKWNELRQLIAGTTSVSGSGGAVGLLRNLDAPDTSATSDSQMGLGANTTGAYYQTFPLRDTPSTERVGSCTYGTGRDQPSNIPANAAYLPHISEGIEESAHNEFLCMSGLQTGGADMMTDRTAIIHGIAIKPAETRLIASKGASLIWSPRSNVVLYGETAPVAVYARSRTNIALGTDWVRSGSMNILRELQCADYLSSSFYNRLFSAQTLWRMVTVNAARAGFVHTRTGLLANGLAADISIFKYSTGNPYRAVVTSHPKDVLLTMRGGKALYGDANVVSALAGNCEAMSVCTVAKSVCLAGEINENLATLTSANGSAYPLVFCGVDPQSEPTCTPMRGAPWLFSGANPYTGVASGTDSDGDGIPDTSDVCANVFNPKRPMDKGAQADADGDGQGDVCDVCPLNASTTTCGAFDASDIDGDGTANGTDNCPAEPNMAQTDTDNDQKGDACDPCPSASNPGVQECPGTPVTIYQAKAPGSAFLGQRVSLSNVLVTATHEFGFVLQVHENESGYTTRDHSAIYVYYPAPAGSPLPRVDVKVGDRVNIPNATVSLFPAATTTANLRQQQLGNIVSGSVSVASSANPLPAFEVVTTADIATGGPKASTYEALLVRVNTVTVANVSPAPGGGEPAPTNEFTVTQTAGGELRVDDLFHLITPPPTANEAFSFIQGVLVARRDNTKIEPRDVTDFSRPPALVSFGPTGQFAREGATAMADTFPTAIKVRMNSIQATDTTVTVTSSDPTKLLAPAAVVIPAGQLEATVQVQGVLQAASVTLVATLAGANSLMTTVRVLGATEQPVVASVSPNPGSVVKGAALVMTVTLDIPGATDQTVTLAASPTTGFGTVPASVVVPANQLSQTFSFTADASGSGSGTVTATLGTSTPQSATVNILAAPATNHIVISEIAVANGSAANDEFVELYNPTSAAVDISGWVLQYKSATGAAYSTYVTMPAGSMIASHGYFLITSNVGTGGYTGSVTPDASRSSGLSFAAASGHVRIGPAGLTTAKNDANAVDTVGYGPTADTPETAVASSPPSGGTIERKANGASTSTSMASGGADVAAGNGYDSGNNSNDFVTRTTREPQNTQSVTEP